MFPRETYVQRRTALTERLAQGIVVLPGNGESPINYVDNAYPFRQDSTFLYYIGLDQPDLAAIIDLDARDTTVFGDELTIDHIVWMGDLPTIAERADRVGIRHTRPRQALTQAVEDARSAGRPVHFLPPYRADTTLLLAELLNLAPRAVVGAASVELIKAVIDQRAHKSEAEIADLERAVATSVDMHEAAIRMGRPGVTEREIAAEVERIAIAAGGRIGYPVIATVDGQTLHNHGHANTLREGDLFLLDAGAETEMRYVGDLTSTFPVSGRFTERQGSVYDIVLRSYDAAVAKLAPGVPNREAHFAAARVIFEGMKDLGIMKGDPDEALAAGAHALVFPHGIGHMLGLDVHDMENLGENHVGYDGQQRSTQFGLKSLRLARPLEAGFVLTIEPGIYFIPQLIDEWRSRRHCHAFINYDTLDDWRGFGGIRNEENYLVTANGARRLGPRKPQTVEELDAIRR